MQIKNGFLVAIVRALVPRALRNAIRRPKVTVDRLKGKLCRMFGLTTKVQMPNNWTVTCHPMCASEFSVFQSDPEQMAEMQIFIQHCSAGMQLVDVGTHWGAFTLAAIKHGGGDSHVVCIEASPQAASVLADNLALNKVTNQATVINAACGDTVGQIDMLTTGAGGADYLVVPAEKRSDTITVQQITVDAAVQQAKRAPTHIKIDVEGFEREVILGASKTLLERRPVVFLELHGDLIKQRKQDPRDVLRELQSLGYTQILSVYGKSISTEDLAAEDFKARIVLLPS